MNHRISLQRAWKVYFSPENLDSKPEIRALRTFHGLPDLPERPVVRLHIARIDGLDTVFLNERTLGLVKLESSNCADVSDLLLPFNRLELVIDPNRSAPLSNLKDFEVWLEIIETQ